MTSRTKDTIFQAALYKCGLRPTDSTPMWEVLEANYDDIVLAAFEDGDGAYPFGAARITLTSRAAGTFGFDDTYTMPNDVLHVVDVFFDKKPASDLLESWRIHGASNSLLCNAESRVIEIEYVQAGAEHTWSANFSKGIQRRLEAVIKSAEEEEGEAANRNQEAEKFFHMAAVKGSKNRNQQRVWKHGGGRIARARSSSYRRR